MDLGTSTLGELALAESNWTMQYLTASTTNLTFTTTPEPVGKGIGSSTSQLTFTTTPTPYSKAYTNTSISFSILSQPLQPQIHHFLFLDQAGFDIVQNNVDIRYDRIMIWDQSEFVFTDQIDQLRVDRYLLLSEQPFNIDFEDLDFAAYKRASILHKRLVVFNEEITEERFLEIFNQLMSEE